MVVNKLVRDFIPAKIKSSGKVPIYHFIDDEVEFMQLLKCKLQEEVAEYLESNNVMELCDIVEVVYALINVHGMSHAEFEQFRIEKANSNGAFNQRVFLHDILEQ